MKTWQIVTLIVVTFLAAIIGLPAASYISAHNTAVNFEAQINKFDKDSQNVLSNYTLKIKEMAQVPDMYSDALKEQIEATFQGRYGEEGSKAMFQWIQEQNIQFDSSMFTNLQAAMEAGRDEFRLSQTKKIDVCGEYEKLRNVFWSGMFVRMAGFPKADIDTKCRVVLDQGTKATFETGIAEPISIK